MTNWRTDGWKYGSELSGVHETRHDAVGAAAVTARKMRGAYPERPALTPREAAGRVYAFKPFHCGYCGETFLTQEKHDQHQPCPWWVKDGRPGHGE